MDAYGTLDVAWVQGFNGQKAEYIDRDVICYKCGNKIKFVHENGEESVFTAPMPDGIGVIAVQGIGRLVAFSNQIINPTVFVYVYPSFRLISELKDGAKLEYTKIAFSSSEYLGTVSGIPDFQLTIWNFSTGSKLATHDIGKTVPSCMTFNPANWRQMCMTTEKELSMWQIERSHEHYVIHKTKLRLPAADGSDLDSEIDGMIRASMCISRMSVKLPQTAVAGVHGEEAEKFLEYQDSVERVVPTEHIWTPAGDIIMGCAGGQLLKIDGESNAMRMLYSPGPRASSALSRTSHTLMREESQREESNVSLGFSQLLTEGSLNCLAIHKKGLFVGGQDGIVRQLDIHSNQIRVQASCAIGVPITSMCFNPPHHRLAVGSHMGSMYICDPEQMDSANCVFDIHHGDFIAVDTFGFDHCVSVKLDGEVQVWQTQDAQLVSSLNIGEKACFLVSSPVAHLTSVGTETGHIYFIDLTNVEKPRIIYRIHMHTGPVSYMTFSPNGQLFITGADDGHVFVMDGRPSNTFTPLGYIDMEGTVNAISAYRNEDSKKTKIVVTSNTTSIPSHGATRLTHFCLSDEVFSNPKGFHATIKCDFDDAAIHKVTYNFASASSGVALADGDVAFTLCQETNKLHKLKIPSEPPQQEFSKDSYLEPVEEHVGHQLIGRLIKLSPHNKWLASCSSDGALSVRAVGALDRPIEVNAHDYQSGGVRYFSFSADASKMLTSGFDGTMCCYKWNFSNSARGKSTIEAAQTHHAARMEKGQAENEALKNMAEWVPGDDTQMVTKAERAEQQQLDKEKQIESIIESDGIYNTPTPVPAPDATWLEVVQLQAHKEEDKQYSSVKQELRLEIRDMRRQLQTMMKTNETVPEIEKLSHHDFDLDTEEQARLEAEGEAEVERIRIEKEFENLAKMYLAELIKRECWDEMTVKGRGLKAFNSTLEVNNYPMKARDRKELEELAHVKALRQIEINEMKTRKELTENKQKNAAKAVDEDLNDGEDVENAGKESPSTTGSLGAEYGGDSELFYSQFELHTREQKMNQVVLLKDAIYRIKMFFNKQFDEVYHKKEQEIAKIKEKNTKILKIINDLNLSNEQVYKPELGVIEKPELLLAVDDNEVKVERFLTPEQRKKLEEEQKAEEERRLREKGDNWRERGLDMMMGGVLEIKKEDELKKDIAMPPFMTAKPESEWTEDEKKAAQEYERKMKELNEEREKYRKQLEAELKKLQSLIQEGTQQFDETLHQLFIRKIKTEMVVYQEELKIHRMKYNLLLEEELDNQEAELAELLEHKKNLKNLADEAVIQAKKNMDEFHEEYRNLEVEEKLLDKNFKKEFNDVPAVVADHLYKLFRRRPRGQRARGGDTPIVDPNSGNPFADRPSTARKMKDQERMLETALAELDKPSNAPEGCEPEVWTRLCRYRREKIANEQMVKAKAQILADMEEFYKRRQIEDDSLKAEIDDLIEEINKLKEERLRFTYNLEVQLLMKQGQVEVDPGNYIYDYRSSILIHRNVVEELNGKIQQLGDSKISSMIESKDFRKGIIQLEWEHKRMTMLMEDLHNKMRDIQNLKVTREIQAFLNEGDHEGKKAKEISVLEQTIVLMKQHHDKNVKERKKMYKELKKTIQEREEENALLDAELQDINVAVNERRHIHQVNADKRSDAGKEQRYREIVQRRKLVDLAKAQAQEVAVLRAEVERLRMRTFPALVQVEH